MKSSCFAILIVGSLVLALAGCGSTTPGGPARQPEATRTELSPLAQLAMEPFTDEQLGITGLAPAGWKTSPDAPGIFARAAGPDDLVTLIQQAAPGTTQAGLTATLLPQLGLDALPESSGTLSSPSFEWDRYHLEIDVPGSGTVVVDLGLTETGEAAYIVLLQSPASEAEALYQAVFLPAVEALAPLRQSSTSAGGEEGIYRHPKGLFSVPIPTNWTVTEGEGYATLTSPDGLAPVHVLALEAGDLVEGIAAAWDIVEPGFSLGPGTVVDEPTSKGIERAVTVTYDTGNEDEIVIAGGWQRDRVAYVELLRTDLVTFQKRLYQLETINSGFTIAGLEQVDLSSVEPLTVDDRLIAELEAYIEAKMEELKVPGAEVAIVQGGKVVYSQVFGVRDLATQQPVTSETMMMIGSTTKPMTTFLMAQLVEDGRLTWDTPVVDILPSFKVADPEITRKITVRNLVCACSGVPRRDLELMFNANELTAESIIESLADFEFFSDFGEAYQYSNQMVASGGYVAALASGGTYGQLYTDFTGLFQERVLDPLGMDSSTFSFDEVEVGGNYATPYGLTAASDNIALPLSLEATLVPVSAAGSLWSNAGDMANFLLTQLNHGVAPSGIALVSPESLAVTWEPQVEMTADASYGLGWIVEDYHGARVLSHAGNTFGFTSELAMLPDHGLGIVVLTNQRLSGLGAVVRLRLLELVYQLDSEVDEMLQFELARAEQARTELLASMKDRLDAAAVEPYLGRYRNEALGGIVLKWLDGALVLDAGEFEAELRARVNDKGEIKYLMWEPPLNGAPIELTRDDAGRPQLVLGLGVVEYRFDVVK